MNNLSVPQKYNLNNIGLNEIQIWNTEAFDSVKIDGLQFFKNCIFDANDLNNVCNHFNSGVLVFSLVYLHSSSQPTSKFPGLIAYPLKLGNLPSNNDKFAYSKSINENIFYDGQDWKNKDLHIKKKANSQTFKVPRDHKCEPASSHTSFKAWIETFKINSAIEDYPCKIIPDSNFPEERETFDKMHFQFDLQFIKSHIINPSYDKFGVIPLIVRDEGGINTGGPEMDYVTIMFVGLDNSLKIKPFNQVNHFLVSGCNYPRPWEFARAGFCIAQEEFIQIDSF